MFIKKSILSQLFVSALIYIMIAWMAVIFVLLTIAQAGDIGEAFMWVIVIGIGGCWVDECVLLVPFAPFLAVFIIVFFVVWYSRLTEYFVEDAKKFFKRYAIAFLIIGIPIWFILIVGTVGSIISGRSYSKEVRYYWNKYGTEEKVTASFSFISPVYHESGNKILIINPDGTEGRILEDFSSLAENVDVYYISPKGNFFIDVLFKTHDHKDEIIELTHTHSRWQWIWIY